MRHSVHYHYLQLDEYGNQVARWAKDDTLPFAPQKGQILVDLGNCNDEGLVVTESNFQLHGDFFYVHVEEFAKKITGQHSQFAPRRLREKNDWHLAKVNRLDYLFLDLVCSEDDHQRFRELIQETEKDYRICVPQYVKEADIERALEGLIDTISMRMCPVTGAELFRWYGIDCRQAYDGPDMGEIVKCPVCYQMWEYKPDE